MELCNPLTRAKSPPFRAELDSGAEYSLFDGSLAVAANLDIFDGAPFSFRLANGAKFDSRVLPIVVSHDDLGDLLLQGRFSTAPISVNILGRDFFDFFKIGFDEHQSEVYLSTLRSK